MENLVPPLSPAQSHPSGEQKNSSSNSLLYNIHNWAFYAFFLGSLVPAVFYYKNCKMLGREKEGKQFVLTLIIIDIAMIALAFTPMSNGLYKALAFGIRIGWVIFFSKKAKEQKPDYEERKKNNPNAKRPKEWPLVIVYIAFVTLFFGFIIMTTSALPQN